MNDDLTPDQRDAVAALQSARGPCPSVETLLDYGELSADDRARHPAHDHISVCSRCQLVLLHTEQPATTIAGALQEARRVRLGLLLPVAAVAVLAIGITLLRSNRTSNVPVETIRGTEIQSLAPVGDVARVTEFSWQSPIRANRYRVKVRRGSEAVWSGETTSLRIDAPSGVFDANVEYRWSVEAIDREGEVRMTSPSRSFKIDRAGDAVKERGSRRR